MEALDSWFVHGNGEDAIVFVIPVVMLLRLLGAVADVDTTVPSTRSASRHVHLVVFVCTVALKPSTAAARDTSFATDPALAMCRATIVVPASEP